MLCLHLLPPSPCSTWRPLEVQWCFFFVTVASLGDVWLPRLLIAEPEKITESSNPTYNFDKLTILKNQKLDLQLVVLILFSATIKKVEITWNSINTLWSLETE